MNSAFARRIYTGRTVAENSYLAFEAPTGRGPGKVLAISPRKQGQLVGEFEVITPAFIDPHCHIGMERAGLPGSEGEANEQMDTIVALADSLDSLLMDDTAFRESVEAGVLYSCIVPGSGNIIGGRASVIRNYGKSSTEALIARAGVKAAFGHNVAVSTREWKGTRPYTRMGAVAILRKRLDEVRQKVEKLKRAKGKAKAEITFSAEEGVIRDLLAGRERLRVHVHKTDDIAALLRIVEEFRLRITVEHACDVHAPEIFVELKRRGIPVVFGPMDSFPYKTELQHESWRNTRHLLDSGVEFGLMTDHPVILQRNLFLQLRHFVRVGLSRQQALEIITRRNAEILGIGEFLGTLEKEKWASFIGWNGDPFDLTRYPTAVYGEGRLIHEEKASQD